MGLVAPKTRKHLSADSLFGAIRTVFSDLPDHRQGDPDIPLSDALMSAFAMFSLKAPCASRKPVTFENTGCRENTLRQLFAHSDGEDRRLQAVF